MQGDYYIDSIRKYLKKENPAIIDLSDMIIVKNI